VVASPSLPPVLVLMGVSGCGKSTVAALLAGRLAWDFEEGDELHPPANIAKMATGHPLDDEDRKPWLERVAAWIRERTDTGRPGIITCSALKRSYRDVLRADRVVFVYLAGTREQIAKRLAARHGHFMPAALLDSQFADLEPPTPDENEITVDISAGGSALADQIVVRLQLRPSASRQGDAEV
jgi:carbohydrate kinase (thermoresistant glucokinase family)